MPILDWKIDKSWSLFLDRDGVINERIFGGYVTNKSDFHFQIGGAEAIAEMSHLFGHVFVITNQQGIAKNLMTERNLLEIHNYMCETIEVLGGRIDAVYYATNLKGAKNDIRKPLPDMAFKAKAEFQGVDFNKSIMVGDTDSDILFGKNLGMKTVLVRSKEIIREKADLEVDSLYELKSLLHE